MVLMVAHGEPGRICAVDTGARHHYNPPVHFTVRRQFYGFARQKTSSGFLWVIIVVAVVTLTMLNIIISLKLSNFLESDEGITHRHFNGTHLHSADDAAFWSTGCLMNDDCSATANTSGAQFDGFHFDRAAGRFDNSRRYRIHDYVQVADQWSYLGADQLVCLATQTSVDRMHWIAEASRHWQGPVSVAVFVPGEDFHVAARYADYLRRCWPMVRTHASFHFLYPAQHLPAMVPSMRSIVLSCGLSEVATLKTLLNLRSRSSLHGRNQLLYPQNHLRNVARKGCPSPYVFLTDVDVVPRPGLGPALHHFLKYPVCDHCAFVVPTYEVDERASMPLNKSLLLQLVREKKAQPFHKVVFINNQFATNSSLWEKLPDGEDIGVAYPVTNFELFYEPFYVARDDVPPHDERFVGYGFTRNTQVYEMFVANFKFLVLNHAFAVHRGLKQKKTKNSWRERQNRANSRLFKKFEREVLARYGNAKRQ